MLRVWIAAFALLLAICEPVFVIAARSANIAQTKPKDFEPDNDNNGFENAQPPSDAVLDALLKTPEAQDAREDLEGRGREYARSRFEVVHVDLSDAHEEDYVVLGKCPMCGADCFWFWIVRTRHRKTDVILFSNGLTLSLRQHKTSGYRDVVEQWATAAFSGARLYRYDGSVYKLVSEHTRETRP